MNTPAILVVTLLCSTTAYANPKNPEKAEFKLPEVQETQIWLKIQRENMMATRYQDTLSPEAAQAAQQRVLKSYSHPLPDKFIQSNFGEK
ncbi:DUF3613 domain-containing protein [Vibrio sp. Vb2880]|uniref:DUF3613 domain-containing protein n=1 Tax=Vibrio furnissii TaxID=29494 RepID=A0A0Q2M9X7_VIBFU|nr:MULTISPECIES: DUF3613 domain-containing protein [Vibrio]KQH84626.1 hypothetical protein AMR76_17635 [Vibrio furnissii]MBO0215323.1 DUF3613 domain-containing protein [Vibrio sp. Vb2880]MCG6232219.1 DUF3613 domain-containing protein [Vibrio furnissii]MCG6260664.1 DUF3613 domain-containing protein [Vibrio furnissii]UHJ61435.1 DUF3613 domain-containing protein [Vibrio furnissii]